MKKYIPFLIIIVFVIALFVLFTANESVKKTEQNKPFVLSMTASVEIPEKMTFAGETVTFDRYDLHERMDRELNSFTYYHSTTMLLFKRANRIFPMIEPILKRHGLPNDLKYLAVIESSLNPRAYSPARAAGLWQFLASTGKRYGLEIYSEVDERYSIPKSTEAACRYLKESYKKYGSWAVAALSYNGGQGRISKELSRQRTNKALDLWLVEETSRYYFRMLAIKQVFENPQRYGFILKPHQLYKPMKYKEIPVSSTIPNLVAFAKKQGISYAILKDNNSWLRDDKLTVKHSRYTILIPTEESLYYRKGEKAKVHDKRWVVQ